MPNKQPPIMDALKLELRFLDSGGYETSAHRDPRKGSSMFLDSPLCLNVLPVKGAYPAECGIFPCSKCWLIGFVPATQRYAAVPCHHIPLNQRGDTIVSLGKPGDDPILQETVRDWLVAKSRELEGAPAQSLAPPQAAGVIARSQTA